MELTRVRVSYNSIFKSLAVVFFLLLFGSSVRGVFKSNVETMFFLALSVLFFFSTKTLAVKIMAFGYYCLMFILINVNIIEFNFIPQAKTLLDVNDNLIYWLLSGNSHAIRLLVAYPGYIFSEVYNINLDLGFSHYGILLFMMLFLVIGNIITKFNCKKNVISVNKKLLLALVPLITLLFIMNGRLIASFLGYAIIIDVFIGFFNSNKKISIPIVFKYLIGLILTMVSSGTMTVAILYTLIMLYTLNYKKIDKRKFIKTSVIFLMVFSPLIYKIFDYFLLMLNRNLIYFGGGFHGAVNMLNHGMGKIVILNKWLLPLFVFIGILVLIFNINMIFKKIKKADIKLPVILAINIAAYGILFGFSTGLMMIPPLIIYILIRI